METTTVTAADAGQSSVACNLAALSRAMPNSFFYLNTKLEIVLANDAFAEPLGKSVEALIGKPIAEVMGTKHYAKHLRHLKAALGGETVEYDTVVRVRSGGDRRHLRITNKPVRDAADAIIGVLSEAVDVTALRRLEQQARESEQRFRMLAQGVPNHFIFLDTDLHVVFCNDNFLRMSGRRHEDVIGRHISEIFGEERYADRLPHYERALGGETVSYESQGAVGHEEGWYRFQYQPSLDAEGNVRGMFSMAIDITERRRMQLALEEKQEELLRSNQDLEQFAYVASHDLKAPLRAIELLVQWIQEDLQEHDIGDTQENLSLLEQRTRRLTRLLDDLLAYSRAGRRVGECRHTDCGALVRDVIELTAPPQGCRVEVTGPLPAFETHATPLEQVLRNLVGNAIKHNPGPHVNVRIFCEDDGDHYVFAVADDGPGIPADYAERVFQMFQTLKPRDQVEGSGMGLAIVQRIVAWQGGRIWFEPGPDGKGTVFKFQWRKVPPAARPDPVEEEPAGIRRAS